MLEAAVSIGRFILWSLNSASPLLTIIFVKRKTFLDFSSFFTRRLVVTTVFEEKKKVQLSKNKSVVIEALETTSMGELESVPDTNINAPSPAPPFPGTDDQGSVATEAHTSHGDTYQ